ncbi:hypothetical protein I316_07225 [Kwoniella heveanensis BCC8398]|uniref:WLM domain-containing protein n=1 Tax=Kwoniella heveanensis BCC8398 TaxID=1296120 RepID=A0A1B9GJ32_9TREE|nr:hypothetical protein I316_07225 [Kwoniella heveanensis BCC8398]
MKTIMRDRFMQVHTLEEAEFNRVFAGRNWNHGQSIELVLRGPSGRFLPLPYIISVMCHEVSFRNQMNHGPKFQKLMADIKADVSRLQSRGYYGDGFWSDGKRLADNVRMGGEGLRASDFPEYVCGVSAADARKAKRPSRGPGASRAPGLVKGEASHRSGRQTEYRRKAGLRNGANMGEGGSRLDGGRQITKEDREARKAFVDNQIELLTAQGMSATKARKTAGERWAEVNPWWKDGSTRGKVAKSKTAAEMRAAAAEARLRALPGALSSSGPSSSPDRKSLTTIPDDDPDDTSEEDVKPIFDEEEEVEDPHIGFEERKREMEAEMNDEEREGLRGGWEDYVGSEAGKGVGVQKGSSSSGQETTATEVTHHRKRESSPHRVNRSKLRKPNGDSVDFGADLIRQERLRALGLAGTTSSTSTRTLGSGRPQSDFPLDSVKKERPSRLVESASDDLSSGKPRIRDWACKMCTYVNLADHGRCGE